MAADYRLLTEFGGPNIRGVNEQFGRALQLGDTVKDRQDKAQLTDIFGQNVVQGPGGESQLNKKGVLTDLYKVQPEKAFNLQEAWGQQDAEMQKNLLDKTKKEIDIQTKMFQMATPENYGQILQTLEGFGITPEGAPPQFQPEYIESRIQGGLQAQQQFKRQDEEVARVAEQGQQKEYKKSLSEFGSKFLPKVSGLIDGLKQSPENFNKIVTAIYQSPHSGKKYANEFLKSIEPRGSNIMDQLAVFETKQRMTVDAAQRERDRKAELGGQFKSAQYKAGNFGIRMNDAVAIMEGLYEKGYQREATTQRIFSYLPSEISSSERKQQDQAERNFINANLRLESGAAIGADEFSSAELQYFPRPGDDSTSLEQKRQNRLSAIASMKAEAGGAWEQILTERKGLQRKPKSTTKAPLDSDIDNMNAEQLRKYLGE